jgi:hypothetical protein
MNKIREAIAELAERVPHGLLLADTVPADFLAAVTNMLDHRKELIEAAKEYLRANEEDVSIEEWARASLRLTQAIESCEGKAK